MKALVVDPGKKNSARIIDVTKPLPEENEILLKILEVGIDGTDREINEGLYGTPPPGSNYLILGHESIGRVEEGNGEFSKDDLVVPTVRRGCEVNCLNCRSGESDMCLTGTYFEHGIYRLHGFASEYAVSDYDYVVKIPEEMRDIGVLLEPMSIVEKAVYQSYNIQERMLWNPEKALVFGAGTIGLLATALLRLKGLNVYVISRSEKTSFKARLVEELGAEYIPSSEMEKVEQGFDLIIEATGSARVALKSMDMMNANSTLCLLGIYREAEVCKDIGKVFTELVLKNRLIFGSVNANKKYFEMGISHILEIKKRNMDDVLKKMITRVKIEDFKKAFEKGGIKTVIEFGSV